MAQRVARAVHLRRNRPWPLFGYAARRTCRRWDKRASSRMRFWAVGAVLVWTCPPFTGAPLLSIRNTPFLCWSSLIRSSRQPIEVGQTNPAPALTTQHEQLVAQDRILGLKPRVRSTRRDPRWSESTRGARSPDQLTRFALFLNRMRFSVQTGPKWNQEAGVHGPGRRSKGKASEGWSHDLGGIERRHLSRIWVLIRSKSIRPHPYIEVIDAH